MPVFLPFVEELLIVAGGKHTPKKAELCHDPCARITRLPRPSARGAPTPSVLPPNYFEADPREHVILSINILV